jgi:Periplasmic copper-binding protein (NosD)
MTYSRELVRSARTRVTRVGMLIALVVVAISCTSKAGGPRPPIRVPQDRPTIQAAVEAAQKGDLVLVAPGTYHEAVVVQKAGITLRGMDRNTVILDGENKKQNGIIVAADGVVVENLTVHGYNGSGVYVYGGYSPDGVDPTKTFGVGNDVIKGYRVSYVTTYNNGLYGIYAFGSRGGQIDHSYASGHPDSGIYVGQCKPCNALVTDVLAEGNAIGYEGTNASGGVYIVNSTFRANRIGMTPNSQKMEKLTPQTETFIAGNIVADNSNPTSPEQAKGGFGEGIIIGGGTKNVVVRNRVSGNKVAGILVNSFGEFPPENNRVEGNQLSDNGVDLHYDVPESGTAAGNCFTANTFTTSMPVSIETAMACPGGNATVKGTPLRLPNPPPNVPYKTLPAPGPQPSMPDAATAPAAAMPETTPKIDLATIKLPA